MRVNLLAGQRAQQRATLSDINFIRRDSEPSRISRGLE